MSEPIKVKASRVKRVAEIPDLNPHKLRDGESLPIVGGPHNGKYFRVALLFGLPNAFIRIDDCCYKLDAANRRWVFTERKTP